MPEPRPQCRSDAPQTSYSAREGNTDMAEGDSAEMGRIALRDFTGLV